MSAATRLLGVDYGRVRIGLAVSDPDRKIAFPLATHPRGSREQDAAYFRKVIADESIGGLVLGLPVHNDGREGQAAAAVREFGRWLGGLTGLPVVYWDERFTTTQAESALWEAGLTHDQRKARRDRVAAQILLQGFLDAGCPQEDMPGPLEG